MKLSDDIADLTVDISAICPAKLRQNNSKIVSKFSHRNKAHLSHSRKFATLKRFRLSCLLNRREYHSLISFVFVFVLFYESVALSETESPVQLIPARNL